MRRILGATTLPLLVTLAACGGDRAGDGWGGTMTDSAGVTVVHNPAAANWTLRAEPVIVEELRIGVTEGAGALQFAQVAAIDVDAHGNIYVLEQQAGEVRVFDADGAHIRTVGRRGDGPGELTSNAVALAAGANDVVYVADVMRQRIVALGADGAEVGSAPLRIEQGIPVKWEVSPDHRFHVQIRALPFPGMDTVTMRDRIFRRDPAGTAVDTLLEMESGLSVTFENGRTRQRMFVPEPMWTITADGRIIRGRNDALRIELFDADRNVTRVITRPVERTPIGEADRRAFLELLRELLDRQGAPPQMAQAMIETMEFNDYYPAYANLFAGPDGTLWVQRIRTLVEAGRTGGGSQPQDIGSPEWDVFDAEGRLLGTARMPERFTPMRVRDNAIYGVRLDDLDVPRVVRLRVTGW